MASRGYPGKYEKGKEILGLNDVSDLQKTMVFHAGTAFEGNKIVTAGGRVLGVTAWEPSLKDAVGKAYRLTEIINFEGAYYRRDIAHRAL